MTRLPPASTTPEPINRPRWRAAKRICGPNWSEEAKLPRYVVLCGSRKGGPLASVLVWVKNAANLKLRQTLDPRGIHGQARQGPQLLAALPPKGVASPERPNTRAAPGVQPPIIPRTWSKGNPLRPRWMVVVSPQGDRTPTTEPFAGAVSLAALARRERCLRPQPWGQQALQEPATVLQQGGAPCRCDPLGGRRLASLQALREEFQERFGFAVAFALDFWELFLASPARPARVRATVSSTKSSAHSWKR